MKVSRAAIQTLSACVFALIAGCSLPNPAAHKPGATIDLPKTFIRPGESVKLSLRLYAPSVALPAINWTIQAGSIAPTRVANEVVYTAPEVAGDYSILAKASAGDSSYEARVTLAVRPAQANAENSVGESYLDKDRLREREAVKAAMHADATPLYLSPSEPEALSSVLFKLRLPADVRGAAYLRAVDRDGRENAIAMAAQKLEGASFDYRVAELGAVRFPLQYWFEWRQGPDSIYFSRSGASAAPPRESERFVLESGRRIPSWAKGMTLYRVDPDRFYDADVSNDKGVVAGDWNASIPAGASSKPLGGDIEGLARKLEYLRTLGTDALLLDPIFGRDLKIESRYARPDAIESERALEDFISRARARGMRVVLDASVPGIDSPDAEKDYLAFARELAAGSLCAGLRAPSRKGESAADFYASFRGGVKTVNPDAVVLSPYPSLPSPDWDLNDDPEAFFAPLSVFLAGIRPDGTRAKPGARGDAALFLDSVAAVQASIPQYAAYGSLLPLDEPGYARLSTRLKSAEAADAKKQGRPEDPARWISAYHAAILLQMSLPGAPFILYGDEAGLEGGPGADSERGYPWGLENGELISFYRDLGALRKNFAALKTGSFRALSASAEGLLAFSRWDGKSRLIVALNQSDSPQTLRLEASFAGMQALDRARTVFSFADSLHSTAGPSYGTKEGRLLIVLAPRSGAILLCPAPKESPPSVDKRPQLRRVFPADKAKDLAPDTRIVMEFSQEMEPSSIVEGFRILPELKGNFVWNGDTCTFVPEGKFEAKTQYTVSLGKELRSASGGFTLKDLASFSFSIK